MLLPFDNPDAADSADMFDVSPAAIVVPPVIVSAPVIVAGPPAATGYRGGNFDNPDNPDAPDMADAAPVPVLPAAPVPPGQIVWTCVFTFPPQPGQAAGVNDGQTVETVVLGSDGLPVVTLGMSQVATTDGVYALGGGQYGCAYACPPGFSGLAQATLTTGPNAGQTDAQAINLGAAVDLSNVSWSAGPAQTRLSDPLSNRAASGSDFVLYIPLSGEREDGSAADPAGNPVAVAVTATAPYPPDFQAATWLGTPAIGLFVRLRVSLLDGNALAAGAYRVTVQLSGTTLIRAEGVLIAL